jgi:hypothetical protein
VANFRVDTSYQQAVAITPSDTVAITHPAGEQFTKAIYVGTTGNITAIMADGVSILFTSVPVGFHTLSVTRIASSGTAASNLVALY